MKKELSPEIIEYRKRRKEEKKRKQKQRKVKSTIKKIFCIILGIIIFFSFPGYWFIQSYIHNPERLKDVKTFTTIIKNVEYNRVLQPVKYGGTRRFITFDTISGEYVFWTNNQSDVTLFEQWELSGKELIITVSPIKDRDYYKPWGGYLRVIEIKDDNTTYFSSDEYVEWVKSEHKSSLYVGYGFLVFFLLLIALFAYPLGVYGIIKDFLKNTRDSSAVS